MSFRKSHFISKIISIFFILLGSVACSQASSSSNDNENLTSSVETIELEPTVFNCVEQQDGFVTLPQKGNLTSSVPILIWKTNQFGSKWNPEKRCYHVSEKLTDTVAHYGGRLGNLDLTYGKIDTGQTVICVIDIEQEKCDRLNMLFTLNKENEKNPSSHLATISNFVKGKATGSTIIENGTRQFISLEALVDRSFRRK